MRRGRWDFDGYMADATLLAIGAVLMAISYLIVLWLEKG